MKYDIIVVGGGFAGVAAAVSAAREGAKVLLLEKSGFLGGAAGNCYINPFMGYTTKIDRLVQLVHVVVFLAEADAGVLLFQNLVHLGGLRDGGGDRGDFVQLRFHLVFGLLQVEPRDLHRLLLDDRRAPVGGEDGEHDDRDEDQEKKGGEELYTHRAVFVAER